MLIYKIYFETGSAELQADAKKILHMAAKKILTHSLKNITVSGYTDGVGASDLNLTLSKERAREVSQFLVGLGVPKSNMKNVSGFGELADDRFDGAGSSFIERVVVVKAY